MLEECPKAYLGFSPYRSGITLLTKRLLPMKTQPRCVLVKKRKKINHIERIKNLIINKFDLYL